MAISIAGTVAFLQIVRWAQYRQANLPTVGMVNYFLAAATVWILLFPDRPEDYGWPVIVVGAATGVLYATGFFIVGGAVRRIGVALTASSMALAVVTPVLVSVLAFGDPWRGASIAGLAAVLIALPFVTFGRVEQSNAPLVPLSAGRRALWVAMLFALGGMEGTFIKIASETGGSRFEAVFLPVLFATAAATSLAPSLRHLRSIRFDELWLGFFLGASNVISNLGIALALDGLPGSVAFPLRRSSVIVVSALLGRLIWEEKLSRTGAVGVGLAVLAAIFLGSA
jgi:drug/metabolite transporter (DMT)-like permease